MDYTVYSSNINTNPEFVVGRDASSLLSVVKMNKLVINVLYVIELKFYGSFSDFRDRMNTTLCMYVYV